MPQLNTIEFTLPARKELFLAQLKKSTKKSYSEFNIIRSNDPDVFIIERFFRNSYSNLAQLTISESGVETMVRVEFTIHSYWGIVIFSAIYFIFLLGCVLQKNYSELSFVSLIVIVMGMVAFFVRKSVRKDMLLWLKNELRLD